MHVGPLLDSATGERVFLCTWCDAEHPLVVQEIGKPDVPWFIVERNCVCDWLSEQVLVGDHADCACFGEVLPGKRPNEMRYFHYSAIAKLLGASGNGRRAKLPECVRSRIASTYPDKQGTATEVSATSRTRSVISVITR